ncbi:unnamed protein product [Pedinophyceae sp. YPF-701]|nr:unnamed protein product [Pedinophyceae sp. YPF-701]
MMVDVKTELQDRAGVQTAAHEARDVPAMEGAAAIGQAAPVALAHPSPAPPPADAHGSDTGEGTAGAKRSYGTADLQVPDDNGNDGSTDGGAATKRPRTGSSGDGSNPDTLRVETVPPVVSWPKPARRRTHPRRRASDGRIRKLRATVDALAKPAAADAGEEANDVAALLLGLAGNPAQDAALPARVARLAAAAQELPASPPTHLCTACGRAVELRHGRRPSFLCHKAPGVAGCGRRAGTAHAVPATGGPPPGAGATPMAPWGAAFALLPVVHAADVAGPPSPTHDKSATATRDASPAARSQRRSEAEDAAHEPAGRSGG